MLYTPSPTYQPWSLIILIVLALIYQYGWKGSSWERRRYIGVRMIVVITIILLPLSSYGIYNLTGIDNGGLYEGWFEPFNLSPEETYTSPILSNRYAVDLVSLTIYVNNGTISVYLCDENIPEVRWIETNFSNGLVENFYLGLPYIFSEFNTPAIWTLNIYNPTQSQADGYFAIFPPSTFDDSLLPYLFPSITLVTAWIVWGVFTLVSYESQKKSLRPKNEHTENTEIQDDEDYESLDEQKYRRIRNRERRF